MIAKPISKRFAATSQSFAFGRIVGTTCPGHNLSQSQPVHILVLLLFVLKESQWPYSQMCFVEGGQQIERYRQTLSFSQSHHCFYVVRSKTPRNTAPQSQSIPIRL